jgi:hypothetical protein
MTPILEFLQEKQLPGWLLVHNANLVTEAAGLRIASFDEAFWSDSFDELGAKIPKAHLKNSKEAKELAGYRFSEEELKQGDFSFDTMPAALMNEGNDKDLFGESWTMFWVAPAEAETTIALISHALESGATGKISPEQIKQCWIERVDRIFFRQPEDMEVMDLLQLHEDFNEGLIPAINALDCAPDEESWEILNEDVFWDDEE